MTRGFVTIATGQQRYYQLAYNLLFSYRRLSSLGSPFAIICDRENEFTSSFDKVIVLEHSNGNYLDKLNLYENLPYDETIFIDADSLAYGDLDEWWKIFEDADDFSLFGYMWKDMKCGRGWFDPEGIGEYVGKVSWIPDFNGGVYFMRRCEICKKVFELARYFTSHYIEYRFNDFVKPADEPVLALAMAIMDCKPLNIHEKGFVFAPSRKDVDIDMLVPRAYCHKSGGGYNVNLVHWSNYRTQLARYRIEVEKMSKTGSLLYWRFRYAVLAFGNVGPFMARIRRRLSR